MLSSTESSGNTCRPSGTSTTPRPRPDVPAEFVYGFSEKDFRQQWAMQSGERAHQRGLSRAVGAQHRHQLAVVDAQVDALEHRLGAVARLELADLQQRLPVVPEAVLEAGALCSPPR
jgi:hypothetical protein